MWWVVTALICVVLAGLILSHSVAELQRRAARIDAELTLARSRADINEKRAEDAETAARRAHARLDRQQTAFESLARDVGWSDDRAKTAVLGSPKKD